MPPFKWLLIPNTRLDIEWDNQLELYSIRDQTTGIVLVEPDEIPGLIAYLQSIIPGSEGEITCQV